MSHTKTVNMAYNTYQINSVRYLCLYLQVMVAVNSRNPHSLFSLLSHNVPHRTRTQCP